MSTSNQESNEPIFPITNPDPNTEEQPTTTERKNPAAPIFDVETLEGEGPAKKEQKWEAITAQGEVNKSIREATPDPGDTYEKWRIEVFKPGIHKLRMWYREPNSRTYINPPNPYLDDMPIFEDLCRSHNRGAIIRVAIYKLSTYGRPVNVTGPLEIPVAPDKEYQMQGYGNPFGGGGGGMDPFGGMKTFMDWSTAQQDKMDKLHQNQLTMQQNQSNNWLNAFAAMNKGGGMDPQMMFMMQQQQAMMMGFFQNMQQQSNNQQQILVAALKDGKNGNGDMLKMMEIQSNQTNTILNAALQNTGDLKTQIGILKDLQELTEPSTLQSIAQIAESINAGDAIANLTGAASERIKGGAAKKEDQTQPLPPVPQPAALKSGQPAAAPPAAQPPATEQPPATTTPAPPDLPLFAEIVKMVKQSYISGHSATDLANTIKASDADQVVNILRSTDPNVVIQKLQQYAPQFQATELTTTAGRQFVLSFLYEMQQEGTTNAEAPLPT